MMLAHSIAFIGISLDDKKQYFAKNNRMAMMLRLLEKIPPTELADLKERAYKIISNPDEY